jgi:hypothetical protein
MDAKPTSAAKPEDLYSPPSSPSNKEQLIKSNLPEIVFAASFPDRYSSPTQSKGYHSACTASFPTKDSSTPQPINHTVPANTQTPHLHCPSTMLPSSLQRRVLNKPRPSLLSHKTTSSDGTIWLHHKSEGLFEVELTRDEFYKLVDVPGDRLSIDTLEWKNYPGLHDLSSLITKHLGKIPAFLHHLNPQYYTTSVITRYKKKKDGSVNQPTTKSRKKPKVV